MRNKTKRDLKTAALCIALVVAFLSDIASAEMCAGTLEQRINCINERLEHVTIATDAGGKPLVIIEGTNVQIRRKYPSDRTGNLIVGEGHVWSSATEGFVAGHNNTIIGNHAVVSGGRYNTAYGGNNSVKSPPSVVSGGFTNSAGSYTANGASVSGGKDNQATDIYTSVSGGTHNTASWDYASVSGGQNNIANQYYASVTGGYNNYSGGGGGGGSTVSGGTLNAAYGNSTSISGGSKNTMSNTSEYSSISGGRENKIVGNTPQWCSISGGYQNTSGYNEYTKCASVSGGYQNATSGYTSSVSGGNNDSAIGPFDWRAGNIFFQDE